MSQVNLRVPVTHVWRSRLFVALVLTCLSLLLAVTTTAYAVQDTDSRHSSSIPLLTPLPLTTPNTSTASITSSRDRKTLAEVTVVVNPSNENGWAARHAYCGTGTSTGSQAFVVGPGTPPLGDGSRQFTSGSDGDSFEEYRNSSYNGVRLDDVAALSYYTYVSQNGGGSTPI